MNKNLKTKIFNVDNGLYVMYFADGKKLLDEQNFIIGVNKSGEHKINRLYFSVDFGVEKYRKIKKAVVKLNTSSKKLSSKRIPKIGLFKSSQTGTPIDFTTEPQLEGEIVDFDEISSSGVYQFDITSLLDEFNKSTDIHNFGFKLLKEETYNDEFIQLTKNDISVELTYDSSFAIDDSYSSNTHQLGKFATGSVDLEYGNLTITAEDFAWQGMRMPVSISHLYNSLLFNRQYTNTPSIGLNIADFSAMKIGNGFKLNIMQSMVLVDNKYVYTDANGEQTYFTPTNKFIGDSELCYYQSEDDSEVIYNPETREFKMGDTYKFDDAGRLISIKDENNNEMQIVYTDGKITSVVDGASRTFTFAYLDSKLTSITAPDGKAVTFTYNGDCLESITHPDGKNIKFVGTISSVLVNVENGVAQYKVTYDYQSGLPYNLVNTITEYANVNSNYLRGTKVEFNRSISAGTTEVTTYEDIDDLTGITTKYSFDDEGEIVGEYTYTLDQNAVGVETSNKSINPYSDGMNIKSNVDNLLNNHSFDSLDNWNSLPLNSGSTIIETLQTDNAYFGKNVLSIKTNQENVFSNGVYQYSQELPKGSYVFSAYVYIIDKFAYYEPAIGPSPEYEAKSGVYLTVDDYVIQEQSVYLNENDGQYTRLVVPFEITSNIGYVSLNINVNGKGKAYICAPQLERNPSANGYNMVNNSNFELNGSWSLPQNTSITDEDSFNMSHSLKIKGDIEFENKSSQDVFVKSKDDVRETFTLSAWAKGYALPVHERFCKNSPFFGLKAVIKYVADEDNETQDDLTEEYPLSFLPSTEGWQFASIQFAKKQLKEIEKITISCEYNYNVGDAFFDNVQLIRDTVETELNEADFAESESEDDLQSSEEQLPEAENKLAFEEVKDAFGNTLTETTYFDSQFGTIYRSFDYDENGNNLIKETDARGNETVYNVDSQTSRNNSVTDRCSNKTYYNYDDAGKVTEITNKDADDQTISTVSYSYDKFDNLTEITRGDGLKYVMQFNNFNNLEGVKIDGMQNNLVSYEYKNSNGRLKKLSYANGDYMDLTYNSRGYLISEKWYNSLAELQYEYRYSYDNQGRIIKTVDMTMAKEYNYMYDNDNLISLKCNNLHIDLGNIFNKSFDYSVTYVYNSDNQMIRKTICHSTNDMQTFDYTIPDDESDSPVTMSFKANDKTFISREKSDAFGRKEFEEMQSGKAFANRKFEYCNGSVPQKHIDNNKVKSSPITNLVSKITLSDGRTISYEYDNEERITKVIDSVEGTSEYTYDALGQLLTEKFNGLVINSMTYDNYGNISSKNGVTYTYDSNWKDKLVGYSDYNISYDALGNPSTHIRTNSAIPNYDLTWEKGRQLKSCLCYDYEYNANGIRTSKTTDLFKYNYVLDGSKILKINLTDGVVDTVLHSLTPIYNNSDEVCGLIYDERCYFFLKNLQGDVIAIQNAEGEILARYRYDAWGACTITYDNDPDTEPNALGNISIATINPFRYRSYYYDSETELYYLQSRYYDPTMGRFINADDTSILNLKGDAINSNLYAYCINSPIGFIDKNGNVASNIIGAVIGGVLGAIGGYIFTTWLANNLKLTGWKRDVFIWGLSGLIGASAAAIGYFIGPYVAKAWYALRAKLSGLVRGFFKGIKNITNVKMKHINTSKHLWSKVLGRQASNVNVKNLIYRAIRNGQWQVINNGTIAIHWRYAGKLIEITGNVKDGIFMVGNAWVWDGISKLLF